MLHNFADICVVCEFGMFIYECAVHSLFSCLEICCAAVPNNDSLHSHPTLRLLCPVQCGKQILVRPCTDCVFCSDDSSVHVCVVLPAFGP